MTIPKLSVSPLMIWLSYSHATREEAWDASGCIFKERISIVPALRMILVLEKAREFTEFPWESKDPKNEQAARGSIAPDIIIAKMILVRITILFMNTPFLSMDQITVIEKAKREFGGQYYSPRLLYDVFCGAVL